METSEIIVKLDKLPEPLKEEVSDFIDFLILKDQNKGFNGKNESGFGGGKGIIGYMSDDFDEPLEEFKDYM